LKRNGNLPVEVMAAATPQLDPQQTPCHSFGAVFAEVAVDPDLGMTRVRRVVAVYDVGRIVNQKTARSQFIGGIVWGTSLSSRYSRLSIDHAGQAALNRGAGLPACRRASARRGSLPEPP
jgi:xanthine dehydrogenase YagR molybdenum-binding subunit